MSQSRRTYKGRVAVLLSACGLLVLSAGIAWADGVIRDGLGAISSGRGGVNIGHADNGEILLDNPAAMVNISGRRLAELSADVLICDLNYRDPENDQYALANPFGMPELSFIRRSSDGQWAFGLGAFAPAGYGANYRLTNPILGTRKYTTLGALGKVVPGVAYRVSDQLSVGGTLGVAVSHAQIEGPFFLQTGPLQGTPTLLDLEASGAAITWSLGLQYQLSEDTTVGLTYQSESRFRLRGNLAADVYLPGPAIEYSDFDARVSLTWPRSVGLGMKHRICDHRRISADVIWFDWPHAFDSLGMELTGASNPLIAALAGPVIRDDFPLDWRDSVSVRVGYERFLAHNRVLRAGYVFHRNPIPEATLTPYIPAILEHAFSVGYGTPLRKYNLDVAYQFSFGEDRFVGASSIVGGDFDSSRIRARAHWIFVSLSRQY